jgi:methionine biosynthesis protein MetW
VPAANSTYYDTYWTKGGFNPRHELPSEVEAILASRVAGSSSCLDVGCGDGRSEGIWLNERAASYIGVDISTTGVETAQSLGLDARLIEDATTLPFPDESFDVVVCFEVLEHLNWPLEAARELHRVLRSGGSLVVTVPNVAYWQRRVELVRGIWNPYGDLKGIAEPWRDPHIRFFSARALHDMLALAGLNDIRVGGHEGEPPGAGWQRPPGVQSIRRAYKRLEGRSPSLLSQRLNAVGTK